MCKLFSAVVVFASLSIPVFAQPSFGHEQLERLVDRVALYQDPLLVQVLTASTFSNQLPDAADYAGHHKYLNGDQLAAAIQQDSLPWDPSVVALIPFPSVIDMMAGDMGWTQQLGEAVLANRGGVMDAVQDLRRRAMEYGYLRSNDRIRVVGGDYIQIMPYDTGAFFVPHYDPYVVFASPRAGFVGGGIVYGPRVSIGASFAPWGWGGPAFGWRDHTIVIDRHSWDRGWENRGAYVHPYAAPYRRPDNFRFEEHHQPARDEHFRGEEHHEYQRREERR